MGLFETHRSLDQIERAPFRSFWVPNRYTDAGVNTGLVAVGAVLCLAALFGATHWVAGLIGAAMLAIVVRNHRRFRERVFFAAAERDRPARPDVGSPDA